MPGPTREWVGLTHTCSSAPRSIQFARRRIGIAGFPFHSKPCTIPQPFKSIVSRSETISSEVHSRTSGVQHSTAPQVSRNQYTCMNLETTVRMQRFLYCTMQAQFSRQQYACTRLGPALSMSRFYMHSACDIHDTVLRMRLSLLKKGTTHRILHSMVHALVSTPQCACLSIDPALRTPHPRPRSEYALTLALQLHMSPLHSTVHAPAWAQ